MESFQKAKLFKNGSSQAVRLPKDFRFEGDEVFISRRGQQVILTPAHHTMRRQWEEFFSSGARATPDFMEGVKDLPSQKRELF